MLRKNFMNGLMAVTALAGLLVLYNAVVAKKGATSPSAKIASFLDLTQAKQEAKDSENNVVGTDNASSSSTTATPTPTPVAAETTPEATPEVTPTPTPEATTSTPSTSSTSTSSSTSSTASRNTAATTYVVKDGDTYGCIAEKYYGSFENWMDVMNANPRTEGFQEYRLFVGAVLTLPALSADQVRPVSTLCS